MVSLFGPSSRRRPFSGNKELLLAGSGGAYFSCEENAADTIVYEEFGNYVGVSSSNTNVLHSSSGKNGSCFTYGVADNFSCDIDKGVPGSVLAHNAAWGFAFWMYNPGTAGNKGILGNFDTSDYRGIYVYQNGTTNMWFLCRDGSGNYRYVINSNLQAGWNCVYLGQNGDNLHTGMTLELNGSSGSTYQVGSLLSDISTVRPMLFGDLYHLNGYTERLDEIFFFPTAPTSTAAANWYNGGDGLFFRRAA